jgi:hypothetical protein
MFKAQFQGKNLRMTKADRLRLDLRVKKSYR